MSEPRKWTIYKYTFPNGKSYIGATTRPLIHRQKSDWSGYKKSKLLYEAIQKYGTDCIEQTILFEGLLDDDKASEMEAFYIKKYKTNVREYSNPTYGYNQTNGGEGTQKRCFTEEQRNKMRERMDVLHEAKKGTRASEETRRRLSISHMGQTRGVMSIEQRRKISNTNSKKGSHCLVDTPASKRRREPVIVTNTSTGETIRFDSCTTAGKYFGVNGASIGRWIKGIRRPPENIVIKKCKEVAS